MAENTVGLVLDSAAPMVGKGYSFAFCKDSGLGADSDSVCFGVVENEFFKENGHIDDSEMAELFNFPESYEEATTSCFVAEGTEDQVRAYLLSNGFTESAELETFLNS